jgi:hypothetical protein
MSGRYKSIAWKGTAAYLYQNPQPEPVQIQQARFPEGDMKNAIWFVTNGVSALACFETKDEAEEYKEQFSEDDDYFYYEIYDISVDDLEDYPDEYDLAIEEGLI